VAEAEAACGIFTSVGNFMSEWCHFSGYVPCRWARH
jgi:hypothetical protein